MFCKHCGQSIGREDRFCARCGQLTPQEDFESDAFHADPPKLSTTAVDTPRAPRNAGHRILDLDFDPDSASVVPEPRSEEPRADRELPAVVSAVEAPKPKYVPARKSSLPVLELLVAVLLVVGAGTAIWILRATLPSRARTLSTNIVVTVKPATTTVRAGKEVDFSASISGSSNDEVDWSLLEGADGGRVTTAGAKAEGGKVWSLAVYAAPRKPGTYHLVASSKADPQRSTTATITVVRK